LDKTAKKGKNLFWERCAIMWRVELQGKENSFKLLDWQTLNLLSLLIMFLGSKAAAGA
jgi:hypothetical protein